MKAVEINICEYGSTGRIMLNIAEKLRKNGIEVYTFSRKWIKQESPNEYHGFFASFFENALHHILAFLTGLEGYFSFFGTLLLVKKLKKISPDVIHLHNLHGWYINIPVLFKYIKKNNVRIIWTLHDCWAFTGHCPHFDLIGCQKWQSGCFDCPLYKEYPSSLKDNSKTIYKLKKKWFTGIKDLTIVTPSQWLANLVRESFLGSYKIKVINNGIDLDIFKPTDSDFRQKYNCEDKFIILGVAFGWGRKKGLDIFIELSKRLGERFKIVLVGTNEDVDKQLPENIISIHRTSNQAELAEIYSAADLFVNPTREDTYPTVNMESIACGTPVITFKTGGSPEILDETCGCVVPKDDIEKLYNEIIRIYEEKPFLKNDCLLNAKAFNKDDRFNEYVSLYVE